MLKYHEIISKINDCPNKECRSLKKDGYRFAFDKLGGKSFIPVVIQQPRRTFKKNYDRCSSCGLSMYGTADQAVTKFNDLIKRNKNIYKQIGDKLAVVKIFPQLGICSMEKLDGHFDFYEYVDCDLTLYSSVIVDLL